MPSDVFGPGKVLVFGEVQERDGTPYRGDMRARLKAYAAQIFAKDGTVANASPTRSRASCSRVATPSVGTTKRRAFEFISTGGYYHSLPGDALRQFIDTAAEVQRAMGFSNEKDHPEVAPSQFEMNYSLHRGDDRRRSGAAVQAAAVRWPRGWT